MRKILLLLTLLPLLATAQVTKDNVLGYLHGTFDITSGGGDATSPKQYLRVEFLDDVFGHRLTVHGRDNETGRDFAEEYNYRTVRGLTKSNFKDGYIYCYTLDARRDTVSKSFQYRGVSDKGYTLYYLSGRAFKLARTDAAPADQPAVVQQQTQPVQPVYQPGKAPFTLPDIPNVVPETLTGAKETFTVGGVSFNLIRVDGGTFLMGHPGAKDGSAYDEERPQHAVTLSTYYMLETEVTQELFAAVMGVAKYEALYNRHDDLRDRHMNARYPVKLLTWQLSNEFCNKLSQLTGHKFRLPTEAEWEYAAKGGQKSRGYRYAGSDNADAVAWYAGNSRGTEHPVAQKQPNELGLYDMSGNVSEWCYDPDGSYTAEAQTDPQQSGIVMRNGKHQVRGGRYNSPTDGTDVFDIRVTAREQDKDAQVAILGHGFRFVVSAPAALPQPQTGNTTISGHRVTTDSQTTPTQQQQPQTGNTTISGRRVTTK